MKTDSSSLTVGLIAAIKMKTETCVSAAKRAKKSNCLGYPASHYAVRHIFTPLSSLGSVHLINDDQTKGKKNTSVAKPTDVGTLTLTLHLCPSPSLSPAQAWQSCTTPHSPAAPAPEPGRPLRVHRPTPLPPARAPGACVWCAAAACCAPQSACDRASTGRASHPCAPSGAGAALRPPGNACYKWST